MDITISNFSNGQTVILDGRLDAHTCKSLQAQLDQLSLNAQAPNLILECSGLTYMSSAGIRVILSAAKQRLKEGGKVIFAGLSGYPLEVLKIAGFADAFPRSDSIADAMGMLGGQQTGDSAPAAAGLWQAECGSFSTNVQRDEQCSILVLGHIEDVLWSRVTPAHIYSKRFSETEYSLGLGALGDKLEDYFGIMGEMMTIGGTMVWLPTDGHDTPDFLIPKVDSGAVKLRTGFNVSMAGEFAEEVCFESTSPSGTTIDAIYRALFDRARAQHPAFKGALALTMRAEMSAVHGSGVTRATIAENKPANGKMITAPENFDSWFEIDKTPRYRDVTALLTGIGLDLQCDLNSYDSNLLGASFYLNPGNVSTASVQLHNHAVFFNPQPFSKTTPLTEAIAQVVSDGDFVDMRHLLDSSTITRAIIGIGYIEDFVADPAGFREE